MDISVVDKDEQESSTSLIVLEPTKIAELFTVDGGFHPLLDKLAVDVKSFVPDVSSNKGRNEIRSLAAKVARTKTYLDGEGKELVARYKELPKKIDEERKYLRDFLDKLKDEVRLPLTQYEEAEAKKEAEIKLLADWEEALREDALFNRERDLRLKEEALAKEAQLKAEADAKAKREAELVEQAKREAEAAAAKRVRDAELAAALAEKQRAEAEQGKQEAERRELEAKALAEKQASEAALQAELAERNRQQQAIEQQQREQLAREADLNHRKAVNNSILNQLMVSVYGMTPEMAKEVIVAIAKGQVDHVKIIY